MKITLALLLTPLLFSTLALVSAQSFNNHTIQFKTSTENPNTTANISGNHSYVNIKTLLAVSENAARANTELQRILQKLRAFIAVTPFDDEGFENSAKQLDRGLARIAQLVNTVSIQERTILQKKLDFAIHMFEYMDGASQSLYFFGFYGPKVDFLVYYILNLNVSLLGFFNEYGDPDTRVVEYEEKINGIRILLHKIARDFADLGDESEYTKEFFYTQLDIAVVTTKTLWEALPNVENQQF